MTDPTEPERYRATMQARTPENHGTTVIVTSHGYGQALRVWLTMLASIRTTLVLTTAQTQSLIGLLSQATNPPDREEQP